MQYSLKVLFNFIWLPLYFTLVGCGGSDSVSPSTTTTIPPAVTVNLAPLIEMNFEDITVDAASFFQRDLIGRFSDEGPLVISLTEMGEDKLPNWLWFNSLETTVVGIPSVSNAGNTSISVTATDEQGLSNTVDFTIRVTSISSELSEAEIAEDKSYINDILSKESKFVQMGVGVNEVTALTHDGVKLNSSNLNSIGSPSRFSAASKESLHINVLTKALLNNERSLLLIAADDLVTARSRALTILEQKITSYEQFNLEFPAFGGFLPWFISEDRGKGVKVYPLSGWEDRLPALDNGQLAWSIFLLYKTLYQLGYNDLASRYEQRFQLMARNAKTIFFDPQRNVVSGISQFIDQNGHSDHSLPPEQLNYIKDSYGLTDPFEGELMVMFISLFSPDLSNTEKQAMWANKFINTRNYYKTSGEAVTVVEGWAFSSHEQWKFLVLPYFDYPMARELFLNGEKVRADFSNRNQFRGFFASVNSAFDYISLLGIQSVASEAGVVTSHIAPYATFPMLLADQISQNNTGLRWFRNVLAYDKMLGDYGVTESYHTSTFDIAPLLTWDGKVLTDLALMGGVYHEIRDFMIEENIYLPFMALIEQEYNKITDAVEGTNLTIAGPLVTDIPMNRCAENVAVAGIINDFDCQQLRSLASITVVENPTVSVGNPSEYVGQYTNPSGQWDALIIDFNQAIDLSSHNVFSLQLMAPVKGLLKVKLEGGNSAETEQDIYVSRLDEWVNYTFDFSEQADKDHQKIAIFFNAGVTNDGTDIYFIDDVALSIKER